MNARPTLLHVLNGDATYERLQPLRLSGHAIVWRDALLDGPVPNGLRTEADQAARAQGLQEEQGISARAFRDGAVAFLRDLEAGARAEVVLWFEEDLFCQLSLAYLLTRKPAGAKWSVICHEQRLGNAPRDVLARFYDERRPADETLVSLATRAWDAYAAPDTEARTRELLSADLSAWPLLARGLRSHLARFPGADGLGLIERSALQEAAAAAGAFPAVFARWNARDDVRDLGAGDMQLALALWRLAQAGLVELEGARDDMRPGTLEAAPRWTVEPTRLARAVLAGNARAELPPRWIGGARVG